MGSTTILVSAETRARLKSVGRKGETYDAIINHLLDLGMTGREITT